MHVQIQQFSGDDQNAVKNFILESWKEFGYYYIQEYDYDLDDIERFYIKTGGMFYVLKEEDKIIGTIAVINKGTHLAELKRLYVDKDYRGKGYGSMLVDQAIEFCKTHSFKKIEFETDKIFKKAHLLYEKRGFKVIREDEHSFYMEKNINKL